MGWIYGELVLISIAAMLSPTTLSFSVLALVLGRRPLRTGLLFYAGALGATLLIGALAAFVIGDAAATSHPSSPKTWVAIVDVAAGVLIIGWVVRAMRRAPDPRRAQGMLDRMGKVASSRAVAVVGAGAVLANPGGFIPLALKSISETDPSAGQYFVEWLFFALVSLLPLLVSLVLLVVHRPLADRILRTARAWLERHSRTVAAAILVLLSISLMRNGISGLSA